MRVLWRFRFLVLLGLLLAVLLSFLSFASVSFKGGSLKVAYREKATWQAKSTLLITERGFPAGARISGVEDPSRFSGLAVLYAQLAGSDAVQRIVLQRGPLKGRLTAAPVADYTTGVAASLPIVAILGEASSPAQAKRIARRGTEAFLAYMRARQQAADIPQQQRVLIQALNRPEKAEPVSGRRKTRPVIVFVAVMIAFLGLAFILENMRPRLRAVQTQPAEPSAHEVRRSA
jgi:capsular polysaccharide biosynthesis protein